MRQADVDLRVLARADRPSSGESGFGITWVLSCLAGAFVTVSILMGVVGFFVVNSAVLDPLETASTVPTPPDDSGGSQESEISSIKSVVVCYWNASSVLRRPPRDYDLSRLCVHCCTHLVYLGASIDPRTLAPVFQEGDTERPYSSKDEIQVLRQRLGRTQVQSELQLTLGVEPTPLRCLKSVRDMDALKTSHPLLKLVLSLRLSGSPAELGNMIDGAEAALARAALAKNVARWLPEHNFDGVEVDWDRLPEELKSVYVDLVKAVRTVTKNMRLQMVVSVHPKWGPSYDLEALHGLSDLLILHPYSKEDNPKMAQPPVLFKEDLVETCEVLLGQLRSRKRVVLALPLFGFAYRLRNSGHYELRAPVRGPAPPGPFTDFRGLLAYFEICLEFSSDLWVPLYDKEADCKIAVNRDKSQWIGYDNKATILNKVLHAKRARLGGVAVVTVDMDDYNGDCGQRNVLLGQIHNALNELDRPPKISAKHSSDHAI